MSLFLSPMASKYIIDNLVDIKSIDKLSFSILLFFVSCLIQPILSFCKNIIFLGISESITYSLRGNIFEFILNAEINFFSKIKQGEIVSRIMNDCEMFSGFITNFFVDYVKNILSIMIVLLGMFYLSSNLTIVVVAMLGIFIIIINRSSRFFIKLSLTKQKSMDNLCVNINHALDALDTIKSFTLENKIINDFDSVNLKNMRNNIKILKSQTIINSLSNALTLTILSFIYGYGSILVIKNELTLGAVVALGIYFQFLIQPIFELINSNVGFKKIRPIINRIIEFSTSKEKKEIYKTSIQEGYCIKGQLDIQNLTFSYNNAIVLNNISMNIKEKEMIAILGHAGAGKSTLINLILGFYVPTKGKIKLDNTDLIDIDKMILRKNIGYIPQNIHLFNDSIEENIRCYNEKITLSMIKEVCKKIGIHDFITSLDEGYQTIINEKISISGGQKQLIAIARALVKKPVMLICDEPTSSLDPESADKIVNLIYSFKNRYTIIMISHNVSAVKNADKIFILKNGELIENGNHDLLIKNKNIYANMLSIHKKHINSVDSKCMNSNESAINFYNSTV